MYVQQDQFLSPVELPKISTETPGDSEISRWA